MKVTLTTPPPAVQPPREVTIVMSEEQAKNLCLFLGQQGSMNYLYANYANESAQVPGKTDAKKMQNTGDSLWYALGEALKLSAGM